MRKGKLKAEIGTDNFKIGRGGGGDKTWSDRRAPGLTYLIDIRKGVFLLEKD